MSLLKRIEQSQQPSTPGNAPGGSPAEQASKLAELRARSRTAPASAGGPQDTLGNLKTRVQNRLLSELDPKMDVSRTEEVRRTIEDLYEAILTEEGTVLGRAEKRRLLDLIIAEIVGLGPLETLLADDTITEIMVNGPRNVYIERKGKLERVPVSFESEDHLNRIIERIVAPLGRRVDETSPYVDARLRDGSRVNAVIPPISLVEPVLTIPKFAKNPITVEQYIGFGAVTPEAMEFMKACVMARLNVVISGGTGSGKTTYLNILSGFIPSDERIVTIENAAELQLRQDHVVTLESRPPNVEGRGEVTIQHLVVNALRMRPDRIVVGEIRDEAALDMLQAMNTGHDGSMTTAHSNGPRDTLSRLETMTLMAGMDLPVRAIREQISSAVNLVCHLERMRDGSRKVVQISEVQGMEGDVITMTDLFQFEQTGIENGKIIGRLRPTGLRPRFMDRIEAAGIHLPPSIFGIGERLRY